MISIMLSYEAELLTIGLLYRSAKNRRERGYFANREERRYGIGRLKREWEAIICFVSPTLADLYCPEEWLGSDLDTLLRELKKKLMPLLDALRVKWNIRENPKAGANDLAECIRALDGDPSAFPEQIPKNAVQIMAEMAIGSPAICCYRMLRRDCEETPEQCAGYAQEIAKHVFVSLFNKAESAAVLDLIYQREQDENIYYQNVFRYCCQGNLQAVLDEFAHVLNVKGDALKSLVIESVADTVSLPIDTQESFPAHEQVNMRSHFAVGYYNAKVNDDDKVARIDRMRKAFNSPFRPFVLSTTSIGQEGLDFHLYCRKVMHWNLPSNPIDLEQREGRVNRFKCLAVRQNIAKKFGHLPTWDDMFLQARREMKGNHPDLVPYWCLPDLDGGAVKIQRIVPMYPYSRDQLRYERIIRILSLYRLTLGQPRQEELISILEQSLLEGNEQQLFMNLSPFYHNGVHTEETADDETEY